MKELSYLSTTDALLLKKASGEWNETGKAIVKRDKQYKVALIVLGSVAGVLVLTIGAAVIRELRRRRAVA